MNIPSITWLYTPPTQKDRVLGALSLQTDAVIYDLEDAVAPADKDDARRTLIDALDTVGTSDGPHLQMRINSIGSPWFADDIASLSDLPSIASVRVPKVESAADLDRITSLLPRDLPVHALVESARGVENLPEICRFPQVAGVSLGEADLRAELRATDPAVIEHIRARLVIASAAGDLPSPTGSAWLSISDHEGLAADTAALARQGFLGRTAIHPSQLPHIRAAFRPSDSEYADAARILEAVGPEANAGASVLNDGTFIDRPVIIHAQRTVALWTRLAEGDS